MSVYDKLKTLGIEIRPAGAPAAAYVMAVPVGKLLFVSGHIARKDGKVLTGQFGKELRTEDGQAAARDIAIDLISTLHHQLSDLNRVQRIVKLLCLVNSAPTFTEQHLVANGCSQLLHEVFGERGRHARSAFGVAQIPLGSCVEIELIAQFE